VALYTTQPIAVMLPKGSGLLAKVNAALAEMESDGTLPGLRSKWFGSPSINTVTEG